ncbi:Suppressor of Sensor Kinase (SLN1) [Gonapodya sp. JEL0774]|nr:Suppressor of Sensor Kinase (SLN1) [Gonapodya sp. JEL0774]
MDHKSVMGEEQRTIEVEETAAESSNGSVNALAVDRDAVLGSRWPEDPNAVKIVETTRTGQDALLFAATSSAAPVSRSNIDIMNTRTVFPSASEALVPHTSVPLVPHGPAPFETAGSISKALPLPTPYSTSKAPASVVLVDAVDDGTSHHASVHPSSLLVAQQVPTRNGPSSPPAFPSPSIPTPTLHERLEWQSMLSSVLNGDVIRSEKARHNQPSVHTGSTTSLSPTLHPAGPALSSDPIAPFLPAPVAPATVGQLPPHQDLPAVAKKTYHPDQRLAIWFGVRAKVRGRSEMEERWWVEQARRSVVPGAIQKVVGFEVNAVEAEGQRSAYQQAGDDASDWEAFEWTNHLISETVKGMIRHFTVSAPLSVVDVLSLVDLAESLFPSRRHLLTLYPGYASLPFAYNVNALVSWLAVTRSLRTQVLILRSWTGSETLLTADRAFIERILKESGVKGTFEKRIMAVLSGLVRRTKEAMVANAQAFANMRLPVYMEELGQLAAFPGNLMEEFLRVRLEYTEGLMRPRDGGGAIGEVVEDFGITLGLAARIKRETLSLNTPAPGWPITSSLSPTYDASFLSSLRFYFRLLEWRLKWSNEDAFFKEVEQLEGEYEFVTGMVVPWCKGGDMETAEQFCGLEEQLLIKVRNYFQAHMAVAPGLLTGSVATGSGSLTTRSGRLRRIDTPVLDGAVDNAMPGSDLRPTVNVALDDQTQGPHSQFASDVARQTTSRPTPPPSLSLSLRSVATAALAASSGSSPPSVALSKWYRSRVLENVRSRSRKLLRFLRRLVDELECAAEYDVVDLDALIAGLRGSGHAIVDCESDGKFVTSGGHLVFASPTLKEKPDVVIRLMKGCFGKEGAGSLVSSTSREFSDGGTVGVIEEAGWVVVLNPGRGKRIRWRSMGLEMRFPEADLQCGSGFILKPNRARLITDRGEALPLVRAKFEEMTTSEPNAETDVPASSSSSLTGALTEDKFPVVVGGRVGMWGTLRKEHKAHVKRVSSSLKSVNRTLISLALAVAQSVEIARDTIRKGAAIENAMARNANGADDLEGTFKLRNTSVHRKDPVPNESSSKPPPPDNHSRSPTPAANGPAPVSALSVGSDMGPAHDLLEDWFTFASDFGHRVLRFVRKKGRKELQHTLVKLAVDWMQFIVRDCVNTDKRTFRWALLALEFGMKITSGQDIYELGDDEFISMRINVARCMSLLVEHVDIHGARQSAREALEASSNQTLEFSHPALATLSDVHGWLSTDVMTHERDNWLHKLAELEEERHRRQRTLRAVGKVLDDRNIEDRNISQLLASVGSSISLRWQQGKYLGGGSFGSVYMGINLDSGDVMAVKEIRFQDVTSLESLKRSILDEMNVMQMLHNPNIIDYYGAEVHKDKVYIFMEFCPTSLAGLLEHGRLEDEGVVRVYAKQMLKGLQYLHSNGIVHRDVKPANTLIDSHGTLKFVDFGASKIFKNQKTILIAGEQNSFIGTPHYMAPEVITGEPQNQIPKGAQDIWSMGCCLLEMITGRKPWYTLDNEWAIMYHIGISGRHPPLPDPTQISEDGADFLRICFTRPAKHRPTATQLLDHPWVREVDEHALYITEALTPSPGLETMGSGMRTTLTVGTLSTDAGVYSSSSVGVSVSAGSPIPLDSTATDYLSAGNMIARASAMRRNSYAA